LGKIKLYFGKSKNQFDNSAIRRFGNVKIWRCGDLEIWRFGDVKVRKCGESPFVGDITNKNVEYFTE
jgi:hypothetical protein